jgi:hypothetical protein
VSRKQDRIPEHLSVVEPENDRFVAELHITSWHEDPAFDEPEHHAFWIDRDQAEEIVRELQSRLEPQPRATRDKVVQDTLVELDERNGT